MLCNTSGPATVCRHIAITQSDVSKNPRSDGLMCGAMEKRVAGGGRFLSKKYDSGRDGSQNGIMKTERINYLIIQIPGRAVSAPRGQFVFCYRFVFLLPVRTCQPHLFAKSLIFGGTASRTVTKNEME